MSVCVIKRRIILDQHEPRIRIAYTRTRYLVSERDICLHLINVDSLYVASVDTQSSIVDLIGDDGDINAIIEICRIFIHIQDSTFHARREDLIRFSI